MISKYEILIGKIVVAFKQDVIPKKVYNKLIKELNVMIQEEEIRENKFNELERLYDDYVSMDEVHSKWDGVPAIF